MKPYFVMLNHPQGTPAPLMEDDDIVIMFKTLDEALQAAHENGLGDAFGFEIFERGTGRIVEC